MYITACTALLLYTVAPGTYIGLMISPSSTITIITMTTTTVKTSSSDIISPTSIGKQVLTTFIVTVQKILIFAKICIIIVRYYPLL